MPRLKCDDVDCPGYGIEELIPRIVFKWNDARGRLEAEEAKCPLCGEQRKSVQEPGPIKMPWFKAENSRNYQNKKPESKVNKYNY